MIVNELNSKNREKVTDYIEEKSGVELTQRELNDYFDKWNEISDIIDDAVEYEREIPEEYIKFSDTNWSGTQIIDFPDYVIMLLEVK